MLLSDIKGLKFPDEFVIKHFFKNGLNSSPGRVLEFGSSNGNNLMLYYQYNWEVTGIDIDQAAIDEASQNFAKLKKEYNLQNTFNFIKIDMNEYIESFAGESFDTIIFPSVIYYTDSETIKRLLEKFRLKRILKKNGQIYFRMRTKDDYRFIHGEKISDHVRRINFKETGEYGFLMSFYNLEEFKSLLGDYLILKNEVILKCQFENIQNNKIINNSDIILWGILEDYK